MYRCPRCQAMWTTRQVQTAQDAGGDCSPALDLQTRGCWMGLRKEELLIFAEHHCKRQASGRLPSLGLATLDSTTSSAFPSSHRLLEGCLTWQSSSFHWRSVKGWNRWKGPSDLMLPDGRRVSEKVGEDGYWPGAALHAYEVT